MNKNALITALLFAIPFGFLMGALYSAESPLSSSILVGIVSGVACAAGIAGYQLWRGKRWAAWATRICAPYAAEGIVHHCYAVAGELGNAAALAGLFVSAGLAWRLDAGGLLVLTGQRLLFVPHQGNRFGKRIDIPLGEILGAGPGYGFSRRSIRIGTRSKVVLHFKLHDNRERWLAALPGKKIAAPGASATSSSSDAPPPA